MAGKAVLKVFDIPGNVVYQNEYGTNVKPKEVNVLLLSAGLCFLSLQNGDGCYIQKFLMV